jgi:hypothetical protein
MNKTRIHKRTFEWIRRKIKRFEEADCFGVPAAIADTQSVYYLRSASDKQWSSRPKNFGERRKRLARLRPRASCHSLRDGV